MNSAMRPDVHTRALLVSLNISTWDAKRYDKKVSAEIARQHGTDSDAGRYNKNLLLKGENSHQTLNSHLAAVRQWHYEQTLPWSDEGWRLLPLANYMQYTEGLRKRTAEYESNLETFICDYPALQDAAKAVRNGLLKDEEYPTIAKLRRKYAMSADFRPLPRGGDFRLNLSEEEIAELAASCEQKLRESLQEAHRGAVQRLYDCLQKMHERLADPKAIYRDTLITNARELCDILPRLNLAEDSNLENIRTDLERLATHEPQELRENESTRKEVADKAAHLMGLMENLYAVGGLNPDAR